MKEVKRVTIDRDEYHINPLGVKKSLAVLTRITKIIGPGLADMDIPGTGPKKKGSKAGMDVGNIITAIAANIEEDSVVVTIEDLLSTVSIQRKDGALPLVNLEADFDGKLGTLFKVLGEAVKHNYGDFLQSLPGIKQATGAATIPKP